MYQNKYSGTIAYILSLNSIRAFCRVFHSHCRVCATFGISRAHSSQTIFYFLLGFCCILLSLENRFHCCLVASAAIYYVLLWYAASLPGCLAATAPHWLMLHASQPVDEAQCDHATPQSLFLMCRLFSFQFYSIFNSFYSPPPNPWKQFQLS